MTSTPAPIEPPPPGLPPGGACALSRADLLRRLESAARRGKLAGYKPLPSPGLFEVEAWGTPFEGALQAVEGAPGAGASATTTWTYRTRLRPAWPWGFGVALVLSVWPGVVLTESMLGAMLPGWTWLWGTTYWWYLPLSIIGGAWAMWVALKRSRATVHASAHEMAAKIEQLLREPSPAPAQR
jgi:hypothetical protein